MLAQAPQALSQLRHLALQGGGLGCSATPSTRRPTRALLLLAARPFTLRHLFIIHRPRQCLQLAGGGGGRGAARARRARGGPPRGGCWRGLSEGDMAGAVHERSSSKPLRCCTGGRPALGGSRRVPTAGRAPLPRSPRCCCRRPPSEQGGCGPGCCATGAPWLRARGSKGVVRAAPAEHTCWLQAGLDTACNTRPVAQSSRTARTRAA